MHNLFLGLAKHTIRTWKDLGILTDTNFSVIQARVDSMNPPPKIGRIPRKIASGFSAFTADEWKHWILIYSLYSLRDLVPIEDYQCWCILVDACAILCQLVITETEVNNAHALIIGYCKKFEELYGSECCTPNMHMACHIKDCIKDYGPLSAFWAFSFERFNGILERTKMSWFGPEKQMFIKFLDLQSLKTTGPGKGEPLVELIHSDIFAHHSTNFSSVDQMSYNTTFLLHQNHYYSCISKEIDAREKNYHELLPPLRKKCFNDIEMTYINDTYNALYPECELTPARLYIPSTD